MSELPTDRSMRQLFSQFAMARELQEGSDDPRYGEAARNLHLLAATVSDVPAEVMLRLSDVCAAVGPALVAQQTLEAVIGVGFERGLFADATAFYEALIADAVAGKHVAPSLH